VTFGSIWAEAEEKGRASAAASAIGFRFKVMRDVLHGLRALASTLRRVRLFPGASFFAFAAWVPPIAPPARKA